MEEVGEEGLIVVKLYEIWESLKKWVQFYLEIGDIEGAMRLIWPLQELRKHYMEDPDREVKLVWG